jgi:hypothetical protein
VVFFTSAVAAGVGAEQLNVPSKPRRQKKYRAIAPRFPENNSGN